MKGFARSFVSVALAVGAAGASAPPAAATITPDRDADALSSALTGTAQVTDASFPFLSPVPECSNGVDDDFDGDGEFGTDPDCSSAEDNDEFGDDDIPLPGTSALARSTTPLTAFPTADSSFTIFTTGDPTLADNANNSDDAGEDLGTQGVRGDLDYDVSIMKVDVTVPAGANCLSFDFRFLSEEYPEYVGQEYNDAFIAELDASTWTTISTAEGSEIVADDNFATDENGDLVSINSTGGTSVHPARASGTTYDAATRLLRAATPVTPGAHSLYLSIFDQGDGIYDTAAFVDNLTVDTRAAGQCESGAAPAGTEPNTVITAGPDGNTKDRTPKFKFKSQPAAGSVFECKVDKAKFKPCQSPHVTPKLSFGKHKFYVRAIGTDPDLTPAKRAFKVVR